MAIVNYPVHISQDRQIAKRVFGYHGQLAGGEIFPCLIRNLSQVSWIRKRDLHILTSMSVTYTSDARFKIVGNPDHDDWNLRIDYVQPRDDGIYECQVNAEPKIYRAITLKVLGEFPCVPFPYPRNGCYYSPRKIFYIRNGNSSVRQKKRSIYRPNPILS